MNKEKDFDLRIFSNSGLTLGQVSLLLDLGMNDGQVMKRLKELNIVNNDGTVADEYANKEFFVEVECSYVFDTVLHINRKLFVLPKGVEFIKSILLDERR